MVEYAHPHVLLQFPEGYFYKMVEQTGASMAAQLAKVAEEAYNRKSWDKKWHKNVNYFKQWNL